MKKINIIITLALIAIFALNSNAQQIGQGKILLVGEIGGISNGANSFKLGDSSWVETNKYSTINFSPKFGFFIADGFAIGLQTEYGINKNTFGNNTSTKNTLGVGPFARFYVKVGKLAPFGEAGFGYYSEKTKWNFGSISATGANSGLFAKAGVGLALFIGEKAAIEGFFGYDTITLKEKDTDPVRKDKSKGTSFSIGVAFFI